MWLVYAFGLLAIGYYLLKFLLYAVVALFFAFIHGFNASVRFLKTKPITALCLFAIGASPCLLGLCLGGFSVDIALLGLILGCGLVVFVAYIWALFSTEQVSGNTSKFVGQHG
jgi:hypothetical protein